MLNICDCIQVYVFTIYHHLKFINVLGSGLFFSVKTWSNVKCYAVRIPQNNPFRVV